MENYLDTKVTSRQFLEMFLILDLDPFDGFASVEVSWCCPAAGQLLMKLAFIDPADLQISDEIAASVIKWEEHLQKLPLVFLIF